MCESQFSIKLSCCALKIKDLYFWLLKYHCMRLLWLSSFKTLCFHSKEQGFWTLLRQLRYCMPNSMAKRITYNKIFCFPTKASSKHLEKSASYTLPSFKEPVIQRLNSTNQSQFYHKGWKQILNLIKKCLNNIEHMNLILKKLSRLTKAYLKIKINKTDTCMLKDFWE